MPQVGNHTQTTGPLAPAADFPGLQQLTYLNAASVAAVPVPVQREVLAFEAQIAGQGTVSFDDAAEARVYEGARGSVARLIGAGVDDVAIMTSATECIAQVAGWLRPRAGQNVVSLDIEFPSVTYPWLRIAKDTGAEIRLAPISKNPETLSEDDVAKLVDKNTVAVCVSHVQYATGHRLDPVKLAEIAPGALLVLDATQSAGVVPLDVGAAKLDVVLSSAYKWLCGPFGAAFCYLHPEIWPRFEPPFVGPRSTVDPLAFDATRIPLAASARRMEYSTVAYAAGLGMASAMDYLLNLGIERILAHNLRLTSRLMDGLEALGASLVTPRDPQQRAGVLAVRFAKFSSGDLVARLRAAGIVCASRLGAVRFSPHIYNDEKDVERCLAEVERIVKR
ncbi:MAG: aminotransferase class V-fold PLP-dependent enzyme [Acidobacteria bacterium]|nr:aminotransferase class V-fold PLP-dependent enzyme [Acidobacteriota bacterium]